MVPDSAGQPPAPADEVQVQVLAVVQEVLGLDEPPRLDASLRDDLTVSSMDTMTLVLTLEGEFDETIEEDSIERLETVADVVALVRERLARGPGAADASSGP